MHFAMGSACAANPCPPTRLLLFLVTIKISPSARFELELHALFSKSQYALAVTSIHILHFSYLVDIATIKLCSYIIFSDALLAMCLSYHMTFQPFDHEEVCVAKTIF